MGRGPPVTSPCSTPQTPAGRPSTAGCSSATSAAACTAAWAATSPSSSTSDTAPGPPPCSRWVLTPWGHEGGSYRSYRDPPMPTVSCLSPADGAHLGEQRGQLHLGALTAGSSPGSERAPEGKPPGQSAVSAPRAVGRGSVLARHPPFTPQPVPAPPSQSSSAPSTRCWPSSTSCRAGMTMVSLPRTSARWGVGAGPPPLVLETDLPPLLLSSAAIAFERADGQPGDVPAPAVAGRTGQLLPPGEHWWGWGWCWDLRGVPGPHPMGWMRG